jgi:cytochrome c551/c552
MMLPRLTLTALCLFTAQATAEPTIAGLTTATLSPEIKGQVLIEELNCVACHMAEGSLVTRSKKAPRLAALGDRVHPSFIEAFIRDPHGVKPGTTMPDVLRRLPDDEKASTAEALTHFLLSLKEPTFSPQPADHVAAALGHKLFQSRGCAACHAPRDEHAAELPMAHSVPLGPLWRPNTATPAPGKVPAPAARRAVPRAECRTCGSRVAMRSASRTFLLQDTRVPGALRYTLYRGQCLGRSGGRRRHSRSAVGKWRTSL